ncbi:MAG: nucleotide sugar dehydrogenase [Candidatus Kapabacteria bacterium]|nr:nucleotide sugar dehydrogenase [Candidatus Kapabacteria bacterium]
MSDKIEKLKKFIKNHRKTVIIQGIGFVGTAMLAVLANAKDKNGQLIYNVIGIDLDDEKNYWKIDAINKGISPIYSTDPKLSEFIKNGNMQRNLMATSDVSAFSLADIVIVDINLDINKLKLGNAFENIFTFDSYLEAIKNIASKIKEETLVIIETTVPPGTTEKVVFPIFEQEFQKRGLDINKFYLSHSYERVMPGRNYINSITDFYRVYSGINKLSKIKTKNFLESFINTKDFPLVELESTTASEMAKVLENSYRAMNIAFIQDWTEFAEKAGVNLFEVIDAIRMRPTHRNIMSPGFGVGGYCLTKDALLADWAYNNLFEGDKRLYMSLKAIEINDLMPLHTLKLIKNYYPDLKNKKITILGVSYLNDVADTRNTPTEIFYDHCIKEGAEIVLHDPIVKFWYEKKLNVENNLDVMKKIKHEIVVFTVRHSQYLNLKADDIYDLFPGVQLIVDSNNILSNEIISSLQKHNINVIGVGKGHLKQKGK